MYYVIKHPLTRMRESMVVTEEDKREGRANGCDIGYWDEIGEFETAEEARNFSVKYDCYELPTDKGATCYGCPTRCHFSASRLAEWNEKCVYGDTVIVMDE